jgi:hypothetical protein
MRTGWRWTALGALLALTGACSGSNSEVKPDGAAGSTGAGGTGGTGGAGAFDGGACDPRASYAEASHLIINVTWPAATAAVAGSGQVHIWGKIVFTASPNGNNLSGTLQACGITLPPTMLNILAGNGMLQIEVPTASWDAPSMPRFQVDGTHSGWFVGGTLTYNYAALVGFTMDNPTTAPWPASYTGITMTNDAEGDTHVGLTSIPRSGSPYTLPPTSILQSARADQLYIVTRQVTTATLTRASCDEASGTATFAHFDNHVVGCHVMGAGDCSPTEVNFIDTNRTIYEITSATAQTKTIADNATCADVRAALPM